MSFCRIICKITLLYMESPHRIFAHVAGLYTSFLTLHPGLTLLQRIPAFSRLVPAVFAWHYTSVDQHQRRTKAGVSMKIVALSLRCRCFNRLCPEAKIFACRSGIDNDGVLQTGDVCLNQVRISLEKYGDGIFCKRLVT